MKDAILKAELCELQETKKELRAELRRAQSNSLRDRDGKISHLLHSIDALKDENAVLQCQLATAHDEATTAKRDLGVAAHEVEQERQELAALRTTMAFLNAEGGDVEAIRGVGQDG